MHVMVRFCNRSCVMHELAAWWATRREAASTGTPLGQDGRPSTCDISDPRRPPWTFDTPNRIVSSVSVGWWWSRCEVCWAPVDFETTYVYLPPKPGRVTRAEIQVLLGPVTRQIARSVLQVHPARK
jgi:hypothetical protein